MLDGLNLNLNLNLGGGSTAPAADQAATEKPRPEIENVIIIGSGPAGWSAAIYAARAQPAAAAHHRQ